MSPTTLSRSTLLILGLLLASPACSSDAIEGAFIFITNTWEDVDDPTHSFSFNSANDGESQGVFDGNESVDNGAEEFPLTGSWANSRVTFSVLRSNGQTATYTARLTRDGLDELVLDGPGGPYTIRRQQ